MDLLALLPDRVNDLWYAFPLIVAVSLVYSATRHEATGEILWQSARVAAWIAGFMAIILIVLALLSRLFL
jgi:hypothetical protein